MKKQRIYLILVPALTLLGCFLYLFLTGENEAKNVRQEVVRFHVVAKDDSLEAQQLKIQVRDGVFNLVQELFADCQNREEALLTARLHQEELEARARKILLAQGCTDTVTVEVGERYFPTKDYGSFSFPAGRYQAVSLRIGEAKGQNFWCVLYPALCLSPAVEGETADAEMIAAVGEEGVSFLKKEQPKQKIKFALAEWFGRWKEKICK